MPYSMFQSLFAEEKRIKLIYAYKKINKFSESKWIFNCCRNYKNVREMYFNTLDMVVNTRGFLNSIFEGIEDIDERPACFRHESSMGGIDYPVIDF